MKVITGTVVDGKIEVPAGALSDGESVAILARGSDEPIRLTAEQDEELSRAVEEIRRGKFVEGDELLAELRALKAR